MIEDNTVTTKKSLMRKTSVIANILPRGKSTSSMLSRSSSKTVGLDGNGSVISKGMPIIIDSNNQRTRSGTGSQISDHGVAQIDMLQCDNSMRSISEYSKESDSSVKIEYRHENPSMNILDESDENIHLNSSRDLLNFSQD